VVVAAVTETLDPLPKLEMDYFYGMTTTNHKGIFHYAFVNEK
jgi:hypothetical protein